MKRRRGLSAEERELWARVAASTQALHPVRPASEIEPPPPAVQPPPKVPVVKRSFRVGQAAAMPPVPHDLAPSPGEHLARQPVVMDRKAHRNMVRGRIDPDGRIDLHGMTLAQAHPELIHFILTAQDRGYRLVLVITGKGKHRDDGGPIPVRMGVLRHQVPQWLRLPPLSAVVMQITEAHLRHGGAGAYYVYLRRLR